MYETVDWLLFLATGFFSILHSVIWVYCNTVLHSLMDYTWEDTMDVLYNVDWALCCWLLTCRETYIVPLICPEMESHEATMRTTKHGHGAQGLILNSPIILSSTQICCQLTQACSHESHGFVRVLLAQGSQALPLVGTCVAYGRKNGRGPNTGPIHHWDPKAWPLQQLHHSHPIPQ